MRQWEFRTGGSRSLYKSLPVKTRNHRRGTFKPAEALSLFLSCQLWLRVPQAGVPPSLPHHPFLVCSKGVKWGQNILLIYPKAQHIETKGGAPARSCGLVPSFHFRHTLMAWCQVMWPSSWTEKVPKQCSEIQLVVGTTHFAVIKVELEGYGAEGLDADRGNLLYTNPVKEDSGRKMRMQIFPNSGDGCK